MKQGIQDSDGTINDSGQSESGCVQLKLQGLWELTVGWVDALVGMGHEMADLRKMRVVYMYVNMKCLLLHRLRAINFGSICRNWFYKTLRCWFIVLWHPVI